MRGRAFPPLVYTVMVGACAEEFTSTPFTLCPDPRRASSVGTAQQAPSRWQIPTNRSRCILPPTFWDITMFITMFIPCSAIWLTKRSKQSETIEKTLFFFKNSLHSVGMKHCATLAASSQPFSADMKNQYNYCRAIKKPRLGREPWLLVILIYSTNWNLSVV